uniref:Uncharacterized protein n=1 Tax=Utricularia reniformis TaxID=192314 RepID=A0A1Y0B0T9_9LAMI|nr:hypothetical protein AEK19_MT0840 [Utricularia reniformis]YP_009382297.1 hypothetical protein AEK19_MT1869 [Utricularia reniformis]ART31072.1 hypothetical protein AEK19_MT0840 [Utricularia reniformis]ART32039.1 hypothetical protein AEK19_MT1869 [Utricularia reniformis]
MEWREKIQMNYLKGQALLELLIRGSKSVSFDLPLV